jgi:hypothetical protein
MNYVNFISFVIQMVTGITTMLGCFNVDNPRYKELDGVKSVIFARLVVLSDTQKKKNDDRLSIYPKVMTFLSSWICRKIKLC